MGPWAASEIASRQRRGEGKLNEMSKDKYMDMVDVVL